MRRPFAKRRSPGVDQSRMSLLDHLSELKLRLLRASVSVLVATALVGTLFYKPVFRVITHPYCSLPADKRPRLSASGCAFFYSGPFDGFNFRLKIALIAGMLVSAPIWLYQLWAFVAPGLHSRERRYTYLFVAVSTVFFAAGATVAYVVMGTGLRVLLEIGGPGLVALLDINRYLSYVVAMLLVFGMAFEFPFVMTLLNRAGILSTRRMRDWRRYVIFGMVAFAAVATPGGDPITMLALAVPLCLLYEGAILVARVNDRRRGRLDADSLAVDTSNISDEVASELHYEPVELAPIAALDSVLSVEDAT